MRIMKHYPTSSKALYDAIMQDCDTSEKPQAAQKPENWLAIFCSLGLSVLVVVLFCLSLKH